MLAGRLQPAGLVIALVNIMPPTAGRRAASDFATLLEAAAAEQALEIRHVRCSGADAASLDEQLAGIDALIVTGAEPQAASMMEEPTWPLLARLADWAADNTVAAIWSCMAAHAVVLRLDGIARRRLPAKLSGVFASAKACDHELLQGLPQRWAVPHSRCNGLDAAALARRGYHILSAGPRVGPDMVAKQAGRSLFLMLQGHPEYGSDALLREYRRDVRRYVDGQRPVLPALPQGYFDPSAMAAAAALQQRLADRPDPAALASLDAIAAPAPRWRPHAVSLFSRWLGLVARCKQQSFGHVAWSSAPEAAMQP